MFILPEFWLVYICIDNQFVKFDIKTVFYLFFDLKTKI